MIAEDISKGKENVKVPVVNELNDEKPSEFGVIKRIAIFQTYQPFRWLCYCEFSIYRQSFWEVFVGTDSRYWYSYILI